jgi:hypothetical protein
MSLEQNSVIFYEGTRYRVGQLLYSCGQAQLSSLELAAGLAASEIFCTLVQPFNQALNPAEHALRYPWLNGEFNPLGEEALQKGSVLKTHVFEKAKRSLNLDLGNAAILKSELYNGLSPVMHPSFLAYRGRTNHEVLFDPAPRCLLLRTIFQTSDKSQFVKVDYVPTVFAMTCSGENGTFIEGIGMTGQTFAALIVEDAVKYS